MPYCKSCGAYIPDGQAACLACGFEEKAKTAAAAAEAQTARKNEQNDDMREILERHRRLQQEKSRQWAENEKARRDQQEENRRWAREEYARRQAEREVEAEQYQQEAARRRQQDSHAGAQSRGGNMALAAISYLSVLFVVPFLAAPDDEYANFHAKQGLRLFIFSAISDIIASIFPIGWILSIARVYFIIKGISNALNGRKEPLPYIGTLGKK